jgi:hypothetical protein
MANETKAVQMFVNESHWEKKSSKSNELVKCTYGYYAAAVLDPGVWSAVPQELLKCGSWLPYREFSWGHFTVLAVLQGRQTVQKHAWGNRESTISACLDSGPVIPIGKSAL